MPRQRLFALLNLLPAFVLGGGAIALPMRFWLVDGLVGVTVVTLIVTSVLVFARPVLAQLALRVAAWVLLVLGSAIVALFALSFAFLLGVHGAFGAFGTLLMVLVLLLLIPYVLVYPAIELRWLGRQKEPA